ncbi:MAG: hypothetical protein Q8Q02_17485 [Nocardioides sp.]|nr:hypothetical protein [Nocardioides sp.]
MFFRPDTGAQDLVLDPGGIGHLGRSEVPLLDREVLIPQLEVGLSVLLHLLGQRSDADNARGTQADQQLIAQRLRLLLLLHPGDELGATGGVASKWLGFPHEGGWGIDRMSLASLSLPSSR